MKKFIIVFQKRETVMDDNQRLTDFIVEHWINYVKKNFSKLKRAIRGVDMLGSPHIRNMAAETGFEMTPKELEETVELLRITIDKLESEGYNE